MDVPKLEGEVKYGQFKAWRDSWNDYCKLTKLSKAPLDEQRAVLRSCFDINMKNYLKNAIGITEERNLSTE